MKGPIFRGSVDESVVTSGSVGRPRGTRREEMLEMSILNGNYRFLFNGRREKSMIFKSKEGLSLKVG